MPSCLRIRCWFVSRMRRLELVAWNAWFKFRFLSDLQDALVRYKACEAFYNIAKVIRAGILRNISGVFDGLCRQRRCNICAVCHFSSNFAANRLFITWLLFWTGYTQTSSRTLRRVPKAWTDSSVTSSWSSGISTSQSIWTDTVINVSINPPEIYAYALAKHVKGFVPFLTAPEELLPAQPSPHWSP